MPFGLGSNSQLGIGIAIRLNNQFSGEAAKINEQLLAMRKNANSAVTSAIRDYRNQAAGIAAAAGAASMGMFRMAEAGAKYAHAINQVFIVGGSSLGKTRSQLSEFGQEMSKMFSRDPTEIASAMFENVKQGITSGLEEITKYQIATATATDESLEGAEGVAANLLNVMNAMDIPREKFKDVANAMTSVANATQSSVASLGEAMKYGAFTAHQFNLPLTTTLALFGKLSQVGINGSMAGTGVNNMLTQMAKGLGPFQSKSQLQAWRMMGLDPHQITDMANKGNITGVLKAVSDATRGMTSIQKGSILPKAFNIRGTRAVEGLFDSEHGNKSIGDILRDAEFGVKNDLVMKQSKAMMNDLMSDFKFFGNAFKRFGIAFANAAAPTLRTLLHIGTKIVNFVGSIVDSPIGKIFAGIATVVIPTIGVLFAFRAAVLTATLALKVIAGQSSVGGFSSLFGAGLNAAGLARFGNKGAGIVKNAAGRYFYPKGAMNAAGEKIGGRLVGKAALSEMGLAEGMAGSGIMSGIGGAIGTVVPAILGIYAGVQMLEFFGRSDNERKSNMKKNNDPLLAEYYKNMDEAYYGRSQKTSYYLQGGKNGNVPGGPNPMMQQQIIINMDGKSVMDNRIQQTFEGTFNRDILFTVPY